MIDLTPEVESIWEKDAELQESCLRVLSSQVRGVSDAEMLEEDVATLRRMGAFFVPDDDYLINILDKHIMQFKYGIYRGPYCTLAERLAIPMRIASGAIIGFVGYSNTGVEHYSLEDEDQEDTERPADTHSSVVIKYLYPPKHVFEKGRYFFGEPEWIERALHEQYVCIVDGLFDAIRLNQNGINAVSLCGSKLTSWHKLYLSFVRSKIVLHDNDAAGVRLAQECCKQMRGCVTLKFDTTKDIDDFMKDPARLKRLKLKFEDMRDSEFAMSDTIFVSERKAFGLVKPQEKTLREVDERYQDYSFNPAVQERGKQELAKMIRKAAAHSYLREG